MQLAPNEFVISESGKNLGRAIVSGTILSLFFVAVWQLFVTDTFGEMSGAIFMLVFMLSFFGPFFFFTNGNKLVMRVEKNAIDLLSPLGKPLSSIPKAEVEWVGVKTLVGYRGRGGYLFRIESPGQKFYYNTTPKDVERLKSVFSASGYKFTAVL